VIFDHLPSSFAFLLRELLVGKDACIVELPELLEPGDGVVGTTSRWSITRFG
jgi:hypothetical protein